MAFTSIFKITEIIKLLVGHTRTGTPASTWVWLRNPSGPVPHHCWVFRGTGSRHGQLSLHGPRRVCTRLGGAWLVFPAALWVGGGVWGVAIVCVWSWWIAIHNKGCPQTIQMATVLGVVDFILEEHLGRAKYYSMSIHFATIHQLKKVSIYKIHSVIFLHFLLCCALFIVNASGKKPLAPD